MSGLGPHERRWAEALFSAVLGPVEEHGLPAFEAVDKAAFYRAWPEIAVGRVLSESDRLEIFLSAGLSQGEAAALNARIVAGGSAVDAVMVEDVGLGTGVV